MESFAESVDAGEVIEVSFIVLSFRIWRPIATTPVNHHPGYAVKIFPRAR
jgi:hypothetical protein